MNWTRSGLALATMAAVLAAPFASVLDTQASSHREAPAISQDPSVDQTDLYAFRSPENPDNMVLVANYYPGGTAGNGPNYFRFNDDAIYAIHLDNDGDGEEEITYALRSSTQIENGNSFLYNTKVTEQLSDYNVKQFYKIHRVEGTIRDWNTQINDANIVAEGQVVPAPIGEKSQPNYESLWRQGINQTGNGKFFVGTTDDPFFGDLNVFDLLNLGAGFDTLAGTNTQSIVLEIPAERLTRDQTGPNNTRHPVIGVWGTTHRFTPVVVQSSATEPSACRELNERILRGQRVQVFASENFDSAFTRRVLSDRALRFRCRRARARLASGITSAPGTTQQVGGQWKQVSRLGMPLVNEVVVPLAFKDFFNGSHPRNDASTEAYSQVVLNPELATLFKNVLGLDAPTNGRDDLVTVFLTGVPGLNQPQGVQPAEMLRLNISTPVTEAEQVSILGVFGGDNQGFPNGRRLFDDVIDIEIQAVAGKLVEGFDVPAELGDGVNANDKNFSNSFPYLALPHTATK